MDFKQGEIIVFKDKDNRVHKGYYDEGKLFGFPAMIDSEDDWVICEPQDVIEIIKEGE